MKRTAIYDGHLVTRTVGASPGGVQRAKKAVSDSPRLVKMASGLVNAGFSLPEWQAVRMIFFAPWVSI